MTCLETSTHFLLIYTHNIRVEVFEMGYLYLQLYVFSEAYMAVRATAYRVLCSAQYHRQHCTLHAFEQCWTLVYAQPRGKHPTLPRLDWMSHQGGADICPHGLILIYFPWVVTNTLPWAGTDIFPMSWYWYIFVPRGDSDIPPWANTDKCLSQGVISIYLPWADTDIWLMGWYQYTSHWLIPI